MEEQPFTAFVVEEHEGQFQGSVTRKRIEDLPPGDLLVRVQYSSLNYKDALSASGNRGVTRNYPHTPGIDAAGTVVASDTDRFSPGEGVIVTSYDLGMNTSGGFGQYIRVPSEWAFPLPENLSPKEAMAIGTAGLTAGMSISRLTEGIEPEDGDIVVSGASGGVGSQAVAILAAMGYRVSAVSGKERDYLLGLGATEVIPSQEFGAPDKRPLLKARFAGGIDALGGRVLENIIKSVRSWGVVTCCGNAASPELNLTVFPFILRGVSLIGIDSQNFPMPEREAVWKKLAGKWRPEKLLDSCSEVPLSGLSERIETMLAGKAKGRTVVRL